MRCYNENCVAPAEISIAIGVWAKHFCRKHGEEYKEEYYKRWERFE